MASLEETRRRYAEDLRGLAQVSYEPVVTAFARVPRERFVGPGPWQVIPERTFTQSETPDSDPAHLYENVLVVIDPVRRLNNGAPSLWARLFSELEPTAGERIVHVGAGTGYYSAILAELAGPEGHVKAFEIDEELAKRAADNLEPWAQAEVVAGDGALLDPGPANVIVVNAGCTHAVPQWLERLEPEGRMLLPLTASMPPMHTVGGALLIQRTKHGLAVRFVSPIVIFPCQSARDPERNELLATAMRKGFEGARSIRSLRIDAHQNAESCWLHTPGFCLSTEDVSSARDTRSDR